MSTDEIKANIISVLHSIAPEASAQEIEAAKSLRDDLDIDSIDCLNFIVRLHQIFGIEVPESDYPRFNTLASAIEYISQKVEQMALAGKA